MASPTSTVSSKGKKPSKTAGKGATSFKTTATAKPKAKAKIRRIG